MDMHAWLSQFHRAYDVQISASGVVRIDAALPADFGRAAVPCGLHAARDLLRRESVGRPAKRFTDLALGEGAEVASVDTDIRIVDVAVDDIAHRATTRRFTQAIGSLTYVI